jgi:hypothetical protein
MNRRGTAADVFCTTIKVAIQLMINLQTKLAQRDQGVCTAPYIERLALAAADTLSDGCVIPGTRHRTRRARRQILYLAWFSLHDALA